MHRTSHLVPRVVWMVPLFWTLATSSIVVAQGAAQPAVISEGEVTGNDVYVRSGPSLNHYTITKLAAGTRVRIIAEEGDWVAIVPPAGTFSLISGDYVDSTDGRNGIVNGDNVRVRAGSTLNDNKYTVQKLLPKGSPVTILGQAADGFMRIAPPKDVSLWIHRDFVTRGSSAAPSSNVATPIKSQRDTPSSPKATQPQVNEAVADGGQGDVLEVVTTGKFFDSPVGLQLKEIDGEVATELAKPVVDRSFSSYIERYVTIAKANAEDQFAARYVEVRIQQLGQMDELATTVRTMRALGDSAENTRREYLASRAQIRTADIMSPAALDAQGELRTSALYPAGTLPRRYRLIDTTGVYERTIGYVEIPSSSKIDIKQFLGRYVGVRASAKRVQRGGVNPVPIFMASELVLLQPATKAKDASENG